MNFWQRRKARNHLHALLHHARTLHHMREDVMQAAERCGLEAAMQTGHQAHRSRDEAAITAASEALGAQLDKLTPPCSLPGWRENFEVLVVALGVAMAFRAYFYQPFQIPTGSMQPTLYGISSMEQTAPRTRDLPGVKLVNWLWSGEWFSRMELRRPGKVAVLWGDDRKPGYTTLVSGRWPGALPPEQVWRRDAPLVQLLAAAGRTAGINLFDRGYDYYYLPNDAFARQTGPLQRGWVPDAPRQKQVAETLRKLTYLLREGAASQATPESRSHIWPNLYPLTLSLYQWLGRDPALLEGTQRNVCVVAHEVCEAKRRGRAVDAEMEQQICALLQPVLDAWANAAAAGSATIPWFLLLGGCGVESPAGELLWAGVVTTGDFVFVNRWIWNFRPPQRGEVMVFSTQGIQGLQQGTHYIKRMCGMPNEELSIHPPEIWIGGAPLADPPRTIARVIRQERLASWATPYAGYQVVGNGGGTGYPHALRTPADHIALGPDEYFAMGDNTRNSLDGRYWGAVPRRNLLGPAATVYWPFAARRWGRIE
jgi:signal peptidase I